MPTAWLWIAGILAVLNWAAVEKSWKFIEYVTKPGTMLALFAWLWTTTGLGGPALLFALGLLFSLAGDVFLMLPRQPFLAGLVAFLLAHVCYIIGFNPSPPPLKPISLFLAMLVGFVAAPLLRRLTLALAQKNQNSLRLPVTVYAGVISLMLLSALLTLTREEWATFPALLASAGAAFFFLSDSLLAWDRFVAPLSHRSLKVMITYHLGQFAIIAGVVLHLLNKT